MQLPPFRPGEGFDLKPVREALHGLQLDDSEATLARAGSDYHWTSPILAERLAGRRPHLVVRPRSLVEVLRVAAACARHRVPLTVRGGGTGNQGQCVPLAGGVVLDTTLMNRVLHVQEGWALAEAGVTLHDLNREARDSAQQLLMWPSTERQATLGGYIAGGHGGIGSIRHGVLADSGNVRRLRVVTLETAPRLLDLQGSELTHVLHAWGSNGIIVEAEVALTRRVPWQHTIALFPSYDGVLQLGLAAGAAAIAGELDLFQLSAVERRITPYYAGLRARLRDQDCMFAQVSPATLPGYRALVQRCGGRLVVHGSEAELLAQGLPSAAECAFHHTTVEALKTDRGVTHLHLCYPPPLDPALVARQMQRCGDEVLMHHEFIRAGGQLRAYALPLVQFFSEEQLRTLVADFQADGCTVYDPHTCLLDEGGMKRVDHAHLEFKRGADPQGLLNPGKLRAWEQHVAALAARSDLGGPPGGALHR